MKRNFKLLVVVLVLVMTLSLASCDKIAGIVDKFVPHEHEFSADWSSDATNHWHAAICDKGEECASATADFAAHTFVEGKCSVCGYDDPNYDPNPECTEHAWGAPVVKVAPTCTEDGVKTKTCTACGATEDIVDPATGHEEVTLEGKAPTCTDAGISSGKQCSVCGEITKAQVEINPTGHNFAEGVCTVCGASDPDYNGPKSYSFHFSDVVTGADKDAIAEGTTYANGYFTIVGTVTQRVKEGAVYCVEVAKNGTGAIQFTVSGTATVEVQFSSTGGSNTSKIGLFDAEGNLVENNEGITTVTGASAGMTVVTYNLKAGTYSVVSPASDEAAGETDYNRGARVFYVNVTDTPVQPLPSGTIEVESFGNTDWVAPADGIVSLTPDSDVELEVWAGWDSAGNPEAFAVVAGVTYTISNIGDVNVVVSWTYIEGEIPGDEPDVPVDRNPLQIGSNEIVVTESDIIAGAIDYVFVVENEGTYTFASSNLLVAVSNANGDVLGRGQLYLEAGTYTCSVITAYLGGATGTYTLDIQYTDPNAEVEPDGSYENPFVWETIPESVTFTTDTYIKVYYLFTATQSGTITFTWPEGNEDSYYDIYEMDGENTTANNTSGYYTNSFSFVIEAGKTYRVGLATYDVPGEYTVTISAVACEHQWSEATCTSLATCALCGATTGDYADHTPGEEPTCTSDQTCTVCGTVLATAIHSWDNGVVTLAPDCGTGTDGIKLYTCTSCGATNEETIWAYHDWVVDETATFDATCTVDGYYKAVCATCGAVDEYVQEAEGHYNWFLTCGETGECLACGETISVEHNLEDSPATCTEAAYCYDCWSHVGEPLGHRLENWIALDPTCTEPGYSAHQRCAFCDYTTAYIEFAPLGHSYEAVVTAPTCTAAGYTTYTCACGDSYVGDEVAATGHNYEDGNCTACQAVDHNYYFPVTIPEALEKADNSKVQVSGTVCAINTAWSDSYGNISVTICDADGNELYVYRLKTNVALGDIITVKGLMGTYNDRQIAAGATATIDGHDNSYDYAEMSIADALKADDDTNVIVTGTVIKINTAYSSQYGNISVTIADEEGNQLYLYRLSGNVSLNQIIKVKGSMDTYSGARQLAGGTFEAVGTHTCSNYKDATCTAPKTCIVCGATEGEALGHIYENSVCTGCGKAEPTGEESEPVTVTKTMKELITQYGWTTSTTKQSFDLDNVVSVKINGGSNTGKAYNGDHIRIYATDSPAGTITISVADGYELASIKITTQTGTYAFLYVDGTTTDICNKTVEVSGSSVVLNSVKNGSDGKQVRVMAIEVVYVAAN